MSDSHSPLRRSGPGFRASAMAAAGLLGLASVTACGGDDPPAAAADDVAVAMAESCGGAEADWRTLIESAQEEGEISVAGPPNPNVSDELPEAFDDQFGIEVVYNAGTSGQTAQKIQSERSAGLYTLDIFLAGGNTMSNVIYGSEWLVDLKSELVSPELSEPGTWQGLGDHAPFVDEPNFNSVAKISIQGQAQFIYNTDLVQEGEITGWQDLLDPKWKGQIVAMDPTRGAGLGFNVVIMLEGTFGFDFIDELFNSQEVVLQAEDRQAADAVSKGQFAVAIGVSEANGGLSQLVEDGLPVQVVSRPADAPTMVSAGYGLLGMMDQAPHPAAAKLFANWLLCPDGNQAWNDANGYQSPRPEIDVDVPEHIKVDPAEAHWDTYDWELVTSDKTDQLLEELQTALQ